VRSIQYWCNRGTSGIDGSMSTAFGAAYADESKLHTLVLGDLSFFYDSNALWNRFKVPNLRIIVINNSGGGIFKIIPGPDTTSQLDEFFTTKHNFSAEFLCKAFDVEYLKADSEASIENSMADFYAHSSNNRPKLMEIFTPYEENDVVLKKYFKFLSCK
jgi:2-succinyl-5-enolpyruvyl-6-hydroxy-3-cyclohexene-1-carboxylate synthase